MSYALFSSCLSFFFPFEGRKGYYLLNGTKKVVMHLLLDAFPCYNETLISEHLVNQLFESTIYIKI